MNCYNHPNEVSVGTCKDCNKGLCSKCATIYENMICTSCNDLRIKNDRTNIIKDFVYIFGLGLFLSFLQFIFDKKPNSGFILFLDYYRCFATIAGWRYLNKLTPSYFLMLPIIGWVFYFVIKAIISNIVGTFVFPYVIFRNIKRWRELNYINKNKV